MTLDEWVWGLREQLSLLRANGHLDADEYPVARVWEEAQIIVKRQNRMTATGVALFQMAVSSLFDKDAGKELKKTVEGLTDGDG